MDWVPLKPTNKIAKQVSIDKQFKPIKVAPAKVR